MNLAVGDIEGGELLVVSQFTLMADTSRGNRPGYSKAARGEVSQPLYESFVKQIRQKSGCRVATGMFGADMLVQIHNDGPVTILIDSKQK
jgi:D-tyrosyl-tRNA(Tyr) deacylase